MQVLVLSDLHLGKGRFLKNGQLNIVEDFFEDDRFFEFCEYYSSGVNFLSNIQLVLNGDIFNLIQIDIDGVFTHIIDAQVTVSALERIIEGHPRFFLGLKKFLSTPNKKVTYIIGNHDAPMAFNAVQERLNQEVNGRIDYGFDVNIHGIHIEHGHRFEMVNAFPGGDPFVKGPNGKQIINLPWGSLFCIFVLPQLKKMRPYIDKVRPISSYMKWTLFHDFTFFWRMSYIVTRYLIATNLKTYINQNKNFKTTLKILKQITIYPLYEKKAKSILKKNPHIHTVVMGHTHVQEWRRYPENKYYFNTGTWNSIPSIDAGLHENSTKLTYCLIDYNIKAKSIHAAAINTWQGTWRPFREEVSTN